MIRLLFKVERETKNTVRYNEQVKRGEAPAIGVLYVRKTALQNLGVTAEDDLVVTLSATWEEDKNGSTEEGI